MEIRNVRDLGNLELNLLKKRIDDEVDFRSNNYEIEFFTRGTICEDDDCAKIEFSYEAARKFQVPLCKDEKVIQIREVKHGIWRRDFITIAEIPELINFLTEVKNRDEKC